MDLDLMKKLCTLNEAQIHNVLLNIVKKKYKRYWESKEYIMAEGDIPVCLLAHMDTVFPTPPTLDDFIYDPEKTVLWAPHGSGFDDLAGVAGILELLLKGHRPHLIFTHGEELGGIGASALVKDFPYCPFKDCRALIELDRANEKDAVYYSCDNKNFERFITNHGFTTAIGTFSDISIIMKSWGIAGVNLSIAYLDEHSYIERLVCSWFDANIKKIDKIIKDIKKEKQFIYQERQPIMIPRYQVPDDLTHNCLLCGILLDNQEKYIIRDEEFPYAVCPSCYQQYYIDEEDFLYGANEEFNRTTI